MADQAPTLSQWSWKRISIPAAKRFPFSLQSVRVHAPFPGPLPPDRAREIRNDQTTGCFVSPGHSGRNSVQSTRIRIKPQFMSSAENSGHLSLDLTGGGGGGGGGFREPGFGRRDSPLCSSAYFAAVRFSGDGVGFFAISLSPGFARQTCAPKSGMETSVAGIRTAATPDRSVLLPSSSNHSALANRK